MPPLKGLGIFLVGAVNDPSPVRDDTSTKNLYPINTMPDFRRQLYSVPSLPCVRTSTVPKRVPEPRGSIETRCSLSLVPVLSSHPLPCVSLQVSFWS